MDSHYNILWKSPSAIRSAARLVQSRLIEGLPEDVRRLPRFKVVQLKWVPSQHDIAQGLASGQYHDILFRSAA